MVGGCWFESNQICQRTTRYKVYMRKVAQLVEQKYNVYYPLHAKVVPINFGNFGL